MKQTSSMQIKSRTYFSTQHIQSAAHFAKLADRVEKEFTPENKMELIYEHQSYVTGTIFTSVAFLEAVINEIFTDCYDENVNGHIKSLDKEIKNIFSNMWERKVPRTASYQVLEKYQIALTLAKKDLFDKGKSLYQNIDILIKLRNSLIHFEPESIIVVPFYEEENDIHKFEKFLKGKFELNPLISSGNAFYPQKCLSAGCAKWAVNSCITLTDAFFERININPTYNHVREKIKDL